MGEKMSSSDIEKTAQQRSKWKLYMVIAICVAPILFSYLTYYVIKPTGRTNYGTLLDPRLYPMPKLNSVLQGGPPEELSAYKGKWIMLQVSSSDCQTQCQCVTVHEAYPFLSRVGRW